MKSPEEWAAMDVPVFTQKYRQWILAIQAEAIEACARICDAIRAERADNMGMRESFGAEDCARAIRLLPKPPTTTETE